MVNKCIECGDKISPRAKRCIKCAYKIIGSWNKGRKRSEEQKNKIRITINKPGGFAQRQRENNTARLPGVGAKISKASLGRVPWNKGLKMPERSKEKNPAWKGGTTTLNQMIRGSDKYLKWRSDVFQRDNWTCQTCGKKSQGDLEAHHKIPLRELIQRFKIKSFNEGVNCEDLWDINNGITLCNYCHCLIDEYRRDWGVVTILTKLKGGNRNGRKRNK